MARASDGNEQLLCSFCGKSQRQVKKLIAGPGVYICDECIDLCNEIIDEELEAEIRERYADADDAMEKLRESGRWEQERESLRLARALDRVAAEVKRIPADLAAARDKLWTPEKEQTPSDTKLWTPAGKEST